MNPVVCAFLLAVSQAVAVAAKGKKSGTKSGSKRKVSIPLIAGIIVAVVVVIIILALFLYVKKRQASRKTGGHPQGQEAPYIIGGQPTGPEKQEYSPYPPTMASPPPQGQWNQGPPPNQYNQGPPPNQYNSPSFPVAHA